MAAPCMRLGLSRPALACQFVASPSPTIAFPFALVMVCDIAFQVHANTVSLNCIAWLGPCPCMSSPRLALGVNVLCFALANGRLSCPVPPSPLSWPAIMQVLVECLPCVRFPPLLVPAHCLSLSWDLPPNHGPFFSFNCATSPYVLLVRSWSAPALALSCHVLSFPCLCMSVTLLTDHNMFLFRVHCHCPVCIGLACICLCLAIPVLALRMVQCPVVPLPCPSYHIMSLSCHVPLTVVMSWPGVVMVMVLSLPCPVRGPRLSCHCMRIAWRPRCLVVSRPCPVIPIALSCHVMCWCSCACASLVRAPWSCMSAPLLPFAVMRLVRDCPRLAVLAFVLSCHANSPSVHGSVSPCLPLHVPVMLPDIPWQRPAIVLFASCHALPCLVHVKACR